MKLRRWQRAETVTETIAEANADHVSLTQMRTALNALPIGVVIYDAGGQEWWLNRAAHVVVDQQRGHAELTREMSSLSSKALHGRTSTVLVNVDRPLGQTLEIRSVSLINGGALLMIEDVTERIITDRVRTDFVANISHELKTPVGALALLAETIAGEADELDSDVQRLARHIVEESHRVARIIDDLLELAKIEFDGIATQEDVSVQAVLADAVGRVNAVAVASKIFISSTEVDADVVCQGDARQLVSAVTNLCENAVKYSNAGAEVHIGVAFESGFVTISVIDYGIGIESEHLDRVFERFYRVDQARSRQTGGTGLGLAIVRHVAANHGGEVNVVSTPGEGSTFSLRLPMKIR
ncbi:MAG: two-component sensor histidine kinase [Ilumatobacteraceae bacterium]|nr:two-component sensor histidine kinase [Ilumatobacteraceae bacterium]